MRYKLVCTRPFHGYERGQEVTDKAEVAKLSQEHESYFVRVAVVEDEDTAPKDAPQ